MMQEDSIFGAEPDDLKRLVRFGLEPDDIAINENNAPPTASVDELMERPGAHIGRYKLLRVLGEGGMGVVYLAQQDKPVTRQIALKVIKPGMDSKRVMARFEAEEQALAIMEHPHVARVYDAGLTGSGRPYFVMEYVKGIPITEHCDKYKLTIEERLHLFLHVCEAVQHAHQKGIIHRDLKPSNILVSIEGNESVPKVIDFGVARAVSQQLTEKTLYTEQGQLIGTPEYMSPEQADLNNQDIDTRTDIYSLGVVLYRLLTGIPPFDPQTLQTSGIEHMRKIICEEEPKTPSTRLSKTSVEESMESARQRSTSVRALQRRLHGDLDWITLKAMEKNRIRRYGSAGELAADIQRHLNHEAVLAGPPSTIYRIEKFVRRNRALVTGAATVIAVLIFGTVVSTVFAIKADHARVGAQAVSDFLSGSVIELIDPYKVASEEITRRSLLNAISENLEQKFTGPPLAEAQIRYTLGYAYWSVGIYELAESYLKPAIEVCQDHLGPEHPKTMEWTVTLGWTYLYQGRFHEAERLFTKTLEGNRRVLGEEHKQTGYSMWSLGSLYWFQGRYEEAEPLLEKAFEISMHQSSEEDWHTVQTMSSLVWIYFSQGRYDEAEQLADKALAINLPLRSKKDYWTLNLKVQLTVINWGLGRYDQAEQFGLEALDGRRSLFGEEHADTLWAMYCMGTVYYSQGRYNEAESIFNKALKTAQHVLGNAHSTTIYAMYGLGTVYLSQEQYNQAGPLLSHALEIARHLVGDEHPDTLRVVNSLAVLHTKQKHYVEAERYFVEALKGRKSKLRDDHPETLQTINDFGVLRREQQHYDEAESMLHQALEARQRKLGDDHPACFESMHELAVLYKEQARYAEAEKYFLEAIEGRRLKLGDTHPHTIESINNLIALYDVWNKPEKAKEWRAKLQQIGALRE
ncbi:tetratricopeptide repeat protein [Planctomycetota bacterium]